MSIREAHDAFYRVLGQPWANPSSLQAVLDGLATHLPIADLRLSLGSILLTGVGGSAEPAPTNGWSCELSHGAALTANLRADSDDEVVSLLRAQVTAALALHTGYEQAALGAAQASRLAALGQLTAGAAHELATPIGAILLQLDSAAANLESGRHDRLAHKIESARKIALKARDMTRRLLGMTRAGVDRAEVSLAEVVEETMGALQAQLTFDGVPFGLELQSDGQVLANRDELGQILTNLVLNAKDAILMTGSDDRLLKIRTYQSEGMAHLEVLDRGPGLSSQVAASLFNPFFTTKPVGKGTGLGLSISQDIARQHGGTLVAENREDSGACFRLSLPVIKC